MEMGHYARNIMIPTLMEWVYKSRMGKHLPVHPCEFFTHLASHTMQVNLNQLDDEYLERHVIPDMLKYCEAFTKEMTPVLKAWCVKCNLHEIHLNLRFKAHYIHHTQIKFFVSWEERQKYGK